MAIGAAFIAAESWHPRVRRDKIAFQKLKRAEATFQKLVKDYLASYLRSAVQRFEASGMTSGPDADEVDRASNLFLNDLDADYEPQRKAFITALRGAYAAPLEIGASYGAADLPKGARFAEGASVLLDVDWSLLDPEVVDWLDTSSATLVTNILETTRNRIMAQLVTGVMAGESRDEIAERLHAVLDDVPQWRARLIAQTEVIKAHSQGAIDVYRKSGVVEGKRWVDGQPGACPLCRNLNGQIVDLDEDFSGGVHAPPRHPGCRCAIAPALVIPGAEAVEVTSPRYHTNLRALMSKDRDLTDLAQIEKLSKEATSLHTKLMKDSQYKDVYNAVKKDLAWFGSASEARQAAAELLGIEYRTPGGYLFPLTPEAKKATATMLNAITNSPVIPKPIYRGVTPISDKAKLDFANAIQVGNTMDLLPASASFSEQVAREFGGGGYVFEINKSQGLITQTMSNHPREMEVIIAGRYKVVNKVYPPSGAGPIRVQLEQVGSFEDMQVGAVEKVFSGA